jgi:tellurite resistance protein
MDMVAKRRLVVPASLFGIVLGVAGLGNGWRIASRLWGLPPVIGEAILAFAALVWLALLAGYLHKWLREPVAARAELAHEVQSGFVALVPLTTLLMALAAAPYSQVLAMALGLVGVAGQLALGAFLTGRLWQGGRDPQSMTTVLYLPTVGVNYVAAMVAGRLGHADWGLLFFGVGALAWLSLESVILQRHAVQPALAPGLRPTVGIQLAPPVVGLVAWLSVTAGPPDLLSQMLFGYGLFQGLMLLRLVPWLRGAGFTPGLWGFTFGVTALATSALWLVERGAQGPARVLAVPLFLFANAFIATLLVLTARLAWRGQLLPALPPVAAAVAAAP